MASTWGSGDIRADRETWGDAPLRWSARLVVAVSWFSAAARRLATVALLTAAGFLILATWVFASDYWLPGIRNGLAGTA
jgi:hypothetical protein